MRMPRPRRRRSIIGDMHRATQAIARGELHHRVRSRRSGELGRLAAAIDDMAERLERIEHARREVLASISHELRTPLTIIRGHAFTLSRRIDDESDRSRLDAIQQESTRLSGLVDDVMDAASLHCTDMRLERRACDLVELTDDAAARFADAAARRDVSIRVDVTSPGLADIDRRRIEQVVGNLVANAVRHAHPGSTIVITVDGSTVLVGNVGDTIAPDIAASLFEPFVQGLSTTGRMGLGLSIARGIMHAHGGDLTLDLPAAARGVVTFRVTFPAPRPVDQAVPATVRRSVRRLGSRALVTGDT